MYVNEMKNKSDAEWLLKNAAEAHIFFIIPTFY